MRATFDLIEAAAERGNLAAMTRLPWLAGWNRPGYMPDGEPAEFESFGDALQYLHGELKLEAERAAERGDEQGEEDADKLETLAARLVETVPANRDFAANAAGYEWWIKESAE
jgi:hypothetical protein